MDDGVAYLSAGELKRAYSARELSPVEVARSLLERIESLNPALNMFVTVTPELALAQAAEAEAAYAQGCDDRPLLGIPFTCKDNIAVGGVLSTGGSLLNAEVVPPRSAPAPERALAAGGVLLGKTNTPEFGWKAETTNRVIGSTRNPWNPALTPGGSSGGAAAAVASGIGPIAIGTDGAGSIRIPASFTGVFGFKASFGLVPYAPNGGLETLGHVAPMSRSTADALLLLEVIAGPEERDRLSLPASDLLIGADAPFPADGRRPRIAWSLDLGFAAVEDEVAEICTDAVQAFEELGCQVEPVEVNLGDPHDICWTLFAAAYAGMHRDNWEEVRDLVDFGRVALVEEGFRLSAADVGAALIARAEWVAKLNDLMRPYDLLVTPTMPGLPFEVGLDHPSTVAGVPTRQLRWTPFTYGANLANQPAASVPCGLTSARLPVGLQLWGGWRRDATVLSAAGALERLRPWRELRPPLESLLVEAEN